MRPRLHHRICARPVVICWLLGALFLWTLTSMAFLSDGVFPAAFSDVSTVLLLLLGYACLAGLGFFVGTIPLFWLVARVCRWVNGAPYVVGDRVTIITGRNAGTTTTVYELTPSQGGDLLPRVELGAEARQKYLDVCDDFTLLRTSSNNTDFHDTPSQTNVA